MVFYTAAQSIIVLRPECKRRQQSFQACGRRGGAAIMGEATINSRNQGPLFGLIEYARANLNGMIDNGFTRQRSVTAFINR